MAQAYWTHKGRPWPPGTGYWPPPPVQVPAWVFAQPAPAHAHCPHHGHQAMVTRPQ